MRRHQRAVTLGFNSQDNRKFLIDELVKLYSGDPRVERAVNNFIDDWMGNFTYRAEAELGYVDSIPVDIGKYECGGANCGPRSGQYTARGVVSNPYRDRVERDLNALNREFIATQFEFIRTHFNLNLTKHSDAEMLYKKAGVVANVGAGVGNYATFRVGDGAPTTRRHESYKSKSADDLLSDWYNNAAKSVFLRDDTQSDVGTTSLSVTNNNPGDCGYNRLNYTKHSNPQLDYGVPQGSALQRNLIASQPQLRPYKAEAMTQRGQLQPQRESQYHYAGKPKTVNLSHKLTNGSLSEFETSTDIGATGVDFYDYEDLGVNPQYDMMLNSSGVIHLNDNTKPLYSGGFGRNNKDEDRRLASRRIFRSNEEGIENGIPRYEKRLYVKNLDRNISETLTGIERDYMVRGYDMSELHKRIDQRRQVHREYDSTFVQDENGKWVPKHYPRRGYL